MFSSSVSFLIFDTANLTYGEHWICGIFVEFSVFHKLLSVEKVWNWGYLMLFNTFSNFSSPASGKY